MKSISILAIVSIIAFLLAIGLIYFAVKPIKPIITTTTSYIPTTYTETLKETIEKTYIITTTYETTQIITSISPTTITKTITQTITFTYIPEEKLDVRAFFGDGEAYISGKTVITLDLHIAIRNLNYTSIYIDPNRNVTIEGRGLKINHPNKFVSWDYNDRWQREPFIFSGNPYPAHEFDYPVHYFGSFTPEYYDPKEIKNGTVYKVSFDYRVIYLNGTWSDWKTYTFNVTYTKRVAIG
ncbi:MAG: hypothetical protein QW272_05150 [Candidatus Methanomethylicaceae archaeon]